MSRPLVSVLLPVRDARPYLRSALRSLARQTFGDFECLVADDGSRDGSLEEARAFARRDRRFRVLALSRAGVVAASLAALEEARAPFAARMDADDVARRDRLERQIAHLSADDTLAAVGARVRLFPRTVLGPGMRAYESWLNGMRTAADVRRDRFVECPVAHPTLLARVEALRARPWRESDGPEDYDLVLDWLERGWPIGLVPRRLLAWRHHGGRLTVRDPRFGRDRFVATKARHLARGFLSATSRYVLWGGGPTGKALARALREHGRTPSRVVDVLPGRLGGRVAGAPVVPPDALDPARDRPLVVAVARPGPRGEIRAALARAGFLEERDFLCAA